MVIKKDLALFFYLTYPTMLATFFDYTLSYV